LEIFFEIVFGVESVPPYVRIPCIIAFIVLILLTLRLLFPLKNQRKKQKPKGKNNELL
jgi:hypothetical protein